MSPERKKTIELINALPKDSTDEEIQYKLYVLRGIEEGLADIENGRVIPHEEVMQRLSEKYGINFETKNCLV